MDKILVVAGTEYSTAVRTKAFLFSVMLMPLLMVGLSFFAQRMTNQADVSPRVFAVMDQTGQIYPELVRAATERDAAIHKPDGSFATSSFVPKDASSADIRDLSEQVRKGTLFAFVEVPKDLIHPETPDAGGIRYYSNSPNDFSLRIWVDEAVNAAARKIRIREAGIDPAKIQQLSQRMPAENLGLVEPAGAAGPHAARVDPIRTMAVPAILMFIVFFVVLTSAPMLFNSVIEEKMSKISEVLLGSVTPFELMAGKLLAGAGIAISAAAVYMIGGYVAARYYGYGDVVSPTMFATMAVCLVMAVLLYGSLFAAVGAACSDLKDAQSLLMPVMLLAMLPTFVWLPVAQSPTSPWGIGLTLIPFASPFLMILRMSLNPTPPAWQIATALVMTSITTYGCVWAAAKVFRTGLLLQGKAPGPRELIRWIWAR